MIQNLSEVGSSHQKFAKALKLGQRLWRDDKLNDKKEWVDLNHPDIKGDPLNIRFMGYMGLHIKTAPEDRTPLRKKMEWETIEAMVAAYQSPEEPCEPEIQELLKELNECHPIEFVRVLNMNPELREATDRRIDTVSYYDMKRHFPGAALSAYSPFHLPNAETSTEGPRIDRDIDAMIDKLPTLKFLNMVHKFAAYMNDEQIERCCVREPLAVLHLAADHLPSEIFVRTFQAAKEQIHTLQASKERSAIFSLNEMAAEYGIPDPEIFLPSNKNCVLKTEEEKEEMIKTNPGSALYAHINVDPGNPRFVRLTSEELEQCARLRPQLALTLGAILKRERGTNEAGLSEQVLNDCAKTNSRTMDYTLRHAAGLVSAQTLLNCAKLRKETTLKILTEEKPSRALLHAMFSVVDKLPNDLKDATNKAVLENLRPRGKSTPQKVAEPSI